MLENYKNANIVVYIIYYIIICVYIYYPFFALRSSVFGNSAHYHI